MAFGVPATGWGSSTPLRITRSLPMRSVTSIVPSGRNAMLHGFSSPRATADTRTRMPSAVSSTTGSAGSGLPERPSGATGMPPWNGTDCWPAPRCHPTMTTSATVSGAINHPSFDDGDVRTIRASLAALQYMTAYARL